MDSEGNDEDHRDNVRRLLWPDANATARVKEEEAEGREKNVSTAKTQRQHTTSSSSSPSSIGHHLTDSSQQQRVSYCPETRRRILKPLSRKAQGGRSSAAGFTNPSPSGDTTGPTGLSDESPGTFSGNPSTPQSARTQPGGGGGGGESPRTAKALRLFDPDNARSGSSRKQYSPGGAGHKLDFEPSPKHYLALGMRDKSSSTTDPMRPTPDSVAVATPRKPASFSEGLHDTPVPARPRSVKTAPPTRSASNEGEYFIHDPMALDDSPSMRPLRRQMEGLSVDGDRFSLSPVAEHPLGPRLFIGSAGSPPQTPTKQKDKVKRGRAEFDKTSSLSGKDIAREREILSQYAAQAAAQDGKAEHSDEDEDEEQDTPKASVLNRHLESM